MAGKKKRVFMFVRLNKVESLSLLTKNLECSLSSGLLITTFEQPSHINYNAGIPHFIYLFFLNTKSLTVLILIGMTTIHDFNSSV